MSDFLTGGTGDKSIKETIVGFLNSYGYETIEVNKKIVVKSSDFRMNIETNLSQATFTLIKTPKIENFFKKSDILLDFFISKRLIWDSKQSSFDLFFTKNLLKYLPNKSL